MSIVLLDLNFTLVANSVIDGRPLPLARRLPHEEYRQWLVELLRERYVILMTARPVRWREATLARIEERTRWRPNEAHFSPDHLDRPPAAKARMLRDHVLPRYRPAELFALESNPQTRAMYARYGIRSMPVPKEAAWEVLPL